MSMILSLNTGTLLFATAAFVLAGIFSAAVFRETNDFKKSTILYAAVSAILFIIFIVFHLYWLFCVGFVLLGFLSLALTSNHYFYKS